MNKCDICGEMFDPAKNNPKQKRCSKECRNKYGLLHSQTPEQKQKRKARQKKRYREDPAFRQYQKDFRMRRYKEATEIVNDFKKCGCSKCDEKDIACLDLHHIDPKTKEFSIAEKLMSKEKLIIELNKCIVLCSNCHRKLHYYN